MSSATTRPRLPFLAVILAIALMLLGTASNGLAFQRLSNGEVPEGTEGDPIDSNDYGGGGGGDGDDDVEDSYNVAPSPPAPILRFGDWVIMLVPDQTLGGTGFTVIVLDRGVLAGETRYAP